MPRPDVPPPQRPAVRRRGRPPIRIDFPAELLRQYRAGRLVIAEVAALYGVSWVVAARELRRAGITIAGPGRRQPRPGDVERFAARLRECRQAAGLTQKGLASQSRLSRIAVCFLECG